MLDSLFFDGKSGACGRRDRIGTGVWVKASDAKIIVTRFTTDVFAPPDRHEAWSTRDWPSIGPMFEAAPASRTGFHNRSERFALGPVVVHLAEMAAQRYERSAARARGDGVDGLVVDLALAGSSRGEVAGRECRTVSGGFTFADLAQSHIHESTDTRTLLLTIPRHVAERAGLDPRALHGVDVAPTAATLVRSHLLAVHAALPDLSVDQADRLGRTTLDLIGVALDIAGSRAPAASQDARDTATLIAARRLIDERLGSAGLTVAWLCARLGVRRTTLYRLFAPVGGVQTFIRDQRLERVRAALEQDVTARLRLLDLADQWNFSDAAHLSRMFRGRYGATPTDFRAACRERIDG